VKKKRKATPRRLVSAAAAAMLRAYCPYSRFAVGAAVLTADNRVFTGCNVENASYGLTVCAERNAISAAVAAGARRITAVAVVTATGEPVPPCGACRQVIAEFATGDTVVYSAPNGRPDRLKSWTLRSLLPEAFALVPTATARHAR
jgi:cytidine deaminase